MTTTDTLGDAIGLERRKVRISAHDPRWPGLFAQEAARILDRLGPGDWAIEHIGSTAVPDLAAKPVIDILLGVASLRAPIAIYDALADLGYAHRPLDDLPDRLFFVRESEAGRTHNLSVCEAQSPFWSDHLRFRDRLRADVGLARTYEALKRALAAQFPDDRVRYTWAKDAFVADALRSQGIHSGR